MSEVQKIVDALEYSDWEECEIRDKRILEEPTSIGYVNNVVIASTKSGHFYISQDMEEWSKYHKSIRPNMTPLEFNREKFENVNDAIYLKGRTYLYMLSGSDWYPINLDSYDNGNFQIVDNDEYYVFVTTKYEDKIQTKYSYRGKGLLQITQDPIENEFIRFSFSGSKWKDLYLQYLESALGYFYAIINDKEKNGFLYQSKDAVNWKYICDFPKNAAIRVLANALTIIIDNQYILWNPMMDRLMKMNFTFNGEILKYTNILSIENSDIYIYSHNGNSEKKYFITDNLTGEWQEFEMPIDNILKVIKLDDYLLCFGIIKEKCQLFYLDLN